MERWIVGLLALATALAACSDDDDGGSLPGDTACEKWQSLSLRDTCDFPHSCSIDPACEEAAIAWMECTAKDLSQCRCETNLQLNCEGSYLPAEGPALCQGEYRAFNDCEEGRR